MACRTARLPGTCGATTACSSPSPRSRTGSRPGGKKAEQHVASAYLDEALADFSGYIAADELYDGPYCVLSIVDNRSFRRLTYRVLDHNPTHADIIRFLKHFKKELDARGLTLHGITTDGSPLYPVPITEVFGEVPHQVCEFHVIKELTQAVLRAVAQVRKQLKASMPDLGRGRPSRKTRKIARRRKQLESKIADLFALRYTPSRSRDGPMEFLEGWGRDGPVYLQADAFGGYDGIYAGDAGGHVTEVACWAHARRKFYDARGSDPVISTQALADIRLLYDVEVQAKESAHSSGIDPAANGPRFREQLVAARYRLRQERAVPRLVQFRTWLESQQAERGGPVLPKSPMGQAIQYALNQWAALCVYTTDGRLAIDNNVSENTLRRVAIGRKNWLFARSDKGGHTAATLFSLIATCQRHRVEPLAYLRDVLTRIAAKPVSQLDQLLPNRWRPAVAS